MIMVSEAQKKANAKWNKGNRETFTVNLYPGKNDPTKADIAAAAARDGMSVNAWIVEAIKEKL
jgi:predicted HicB family RNase H-like nuclease